MYRFCYIKTRGVESPVVLVLRFSPPAAYVSPTPVATPTTPTVAHNFHSRNTLFAALAESLIRDEFADVEKKKKEEDKQKREGVKEGIAGEQQQGAKL